MVQNQNWTKKVDSFIKSLQKLFSLEVIVVDEYYSSEIAKQKFLETLPSQKTKTR